MTRLETGYLNRARIARHVKARAIEAHREAWSADRAGAGSNRVETMPDRARPTEQSPRPAPAA